MCSITITKEDNKTRERRKVTFLDTAKQYPTELEAKQWASTFALHRFSSHLSIYRLLPPNHQDYWAALEIVRKQANIYIQTYDYAPDPFSVEEAKLKASKEKEKIERDRLDRQQKMIEKQQQEYPAIHLPTEMRHRIEEIIKNISGKTRELSLESVKTESEQEYDPHLETLLIEKGFRNAHAIEALRYCSTLTEALDWLCIHVPEDGL